MKTSAGAALGSLPLAHAALAMLRTLPLERIGVQLYTVRKLMQADFAGTLEQVAAIGYKEVEFAGYFDNDPETVRTLLDRLGLTAPAAHVPIDLLRKDLPGVIETARIIGHHYVVCPWLAPEERVPKTYRENAAFFNRVGEACRKAGLVFAYHNHDFEFEPMEGRMPYDLLLEETDSDLVKMELDLFWITRGGQDPLAYFKRYPGRFSLCHVKDMGEGGKMVAVGQGHIDFAKIFAQASEAGLQHYFVEHDNPDDALASIRASYTYLSGLTF